MSILATDYTESKKIATSEQEGLRADRSYTRAINTLSLCVEDANTHKHGIVLCYLEFKGAFPSSNRDHFFPTFLRLQADFTRIVYNLYSRANAEFVTPHGRKSPVRARQGTLPGDPLSPLLFDLLIEALIMWMKAPHKGYDISSYGLQLTSIWYAENGPRITESIEDMGALLNLAK